MTKLIFYTADWCKWCKVAKPLIDRLESPEVEIFNCNTEDEKQEARNRGIKELPTLILVENGQEVRRTSQLETMEEVTNFILGL